MFIKPLPKINSLKILQFLILLFVIAIPIADHTRFSILFNRLIPVRLIFLILLGFSLVFLIVYIKKVGKEKFEKAASEFVKDRFFLLLAFIWLVRVISISFSQNLKASLSLLAFYTSVIILYLILRFVLVKSRFFVFQIIRVYVYVGILIGLYGLLQWLLHFTSIILPGVLVGGDYIRIPGTYFDANHFPAYLASLAPLVLVFGWLTKDPYKKVLSWLIFFILTIVVLYTFSRSGVIAFGFATISLLILSIYFGFLKKVVPLIVILVLTSAVVFVSDRTPKSLLDRARSVFNTSEKSTIAHRLLISGEIELFLENPILGVGYGGFSEKFRATKYGLEHLKIDPNPQIRLPPHSVWFETLTETGLAGIIPYSIFMASVLIYLFKFIKQTSNKIIRLYGIGIFSGIVGVLTGGLFYSYNLEFFWFIIFLGILFPLCVQILLKEKLIFEEKITREKLPWGEILPALSVVAFAGVLTFWQLGKLHLIDWDEAIYAGVAKSMVLTKDFLTPTWAGNLWFEKPPLYMWLTAFLYKFYGQTAFVARFWAASFGVLGVLFTYLLARKLFGRFVGILSGIILATTFHYLYYSRNGILDVPVTFFMVACIFFFILGREKPIWFVLSGLFLGLGVMTKGTVAFLILPALLSLVIFEENKKVFLNRYLGLGFGAFLLTVLPWHLYMYFKHGKTFLESYLFYHVFLRATSSIEGKSAETLVYIKVIRNSMRIWYLPLLPALIWSLWQIFKKNKNIIFLSVWAAFIFLAFSAANSKLIWYIIPIYPPLAILTAKFISEVLGYIQEYLKIYIGSLVKIIRPTSLIFLIILASGYVFHRWDLIMPKDFTYDEVKLILEKDELDRTSGVPFVIAGFAPPVPRYYSNSPLILVPKEEFEGVILQGGRKFALVEREEAERVKKIFAQRAFDQEYWLAVSSGKRNSDQAYWIVATSGNLALVDRW